MKYLRRTNEGDDRGIRSAEYQRMIKRVAERLWREKPEGVIPWEVFTTQWIKDDLPRPGTTTERFYIQYRSNFWVDDMNSYYRQNDIPCKLIVKANRGVTLYIDEGASYKIRITRIKKIVSAAKNATVEIEEAKGAFPAKERRRLSAIQDMASNMILQIVGETQINRQLTKEDKLEVERLGRKALPENFSEEEE